MAASPIRSIKLVHWKVFPTALIEFICRFPSLGTLAAEGVDYIVGFPDWRRPLKFPRFAGRFVFADSNGHGHGSAEGFLRHLSRLPLGFREISIDVGPSGASDPVITILERCPLVYARASVYHAYPPGIATVPPFFNC